MSTVLNLTTRVDLHVNLVSLNLELSKSRSSSCLNRLKREKEKYLLKTIYVGAESTLCIRTTKFVPPNIVGCTNYFSDSLPLLTGTDQKLLGLVQLSHRDYYSSRGMI